MPISYKLKMKLKGVFYKVFGFAYKNTISYQLWNIFNVKDIRTDVITVSEEEENNFLFNKKFAIQLHLFYVDLLDEFKAYFENIPYKFDLLVSIMDEKDREYVLKEFKKIANVEKVIIEVVENRGRDVSPLISVFGKTILDYDYLMHIHSKKSLFTGGEQTEWRKYLLDSLMGTEKIIKSHLYLLENGENVGMVYPETFYKMPYYGYTWLKNKNSRDELLNRIGVKIKLEANYIDYPMGTMFIAKVDAIKSFFAADIKVSEFPKEAGQIDGTIAHAFERCIGVVCRYNGYNMLVYDINEKNYVYNLGMKNIKQYLLKSYTQLKKELELYEVISFDVFDTLIARKISSPDKILDIVEEKVNFEYKESTDLKRIRIEAAHNYRINHIDKDPDLDDIYEEVRKITNWNIEKINAIKNIELAIEMNLIVPKNEMIKVLKYAKNKLKKQVNLISDMHLKKEDIEKMLEKCGIFKEDYDEFYLSSSMNLRKDDSSMWKYYTDKYGIEKCIHIGDNEVSDCQIPGDFKMASYHILEPKSLMQLSSFGKKTDYIEVKNTSDSIMQGLFLNSLFNDPFAYNDNNLNLKISSAKDLGYNVLGQVLLNYTLWLIKETKENNYKKILFLSREGFLLKQVYDLVAKYVGMDAESEYLYVSRRALSIAAIDNETDFDNLLDIYYEGSLKNLFLKRFGIEVSNASDEIVKLPEDKQKVKIAMEPFNKVILENAEVEKANYLGYIEKVLSNVDANEKIMVSDIGYSGTIQYYLSKVTNRAYDGRYIVTDNKKKPLLIEGNTIKGFYDDGTMQDLTKSYIHKYHLLLESILISPNGQLLKMDENAKTVYEVEENPLYNNLIIEIHEGALTYIKDYCETINIENILEIPSKEFPENIVKFVVQNDVVSEELRDALVVEDSYCSDGKIKVLDFYKS
jgi:FMN phosphatase YigB (HAD superfamily)